VIYNEVTGYFDVKLIKIVAAKSLTLKVQLDELISTLDTLIYKKENEEIIRS